MPLGNPKTKSLFSRRSNNKVIQFARPFYRWSHLFKEEPLSIFSYIKHKRTVMDGCSVLNTNKIIYYTT